MMKTELKTNSYWRKAVLPGGVVQLKVLFTVNIDMYCSGDQLYLHKIDKNAKKSALLLELKKLQQLVASHEIVTDHPTHTNKSLVT